MPQPNDLSRSLVALDQNSTIIAVVELSHSSWLVGGVLPGIERQPRKKLEPSPERRLALLHRWRDEAVKAGRKITRIALAFEAGRDGFWLARWLRARGVEAHVIRASSVAVSREHRRAQTDRLDTELLPTEVLAGLVDRVTFHNSENGFCVLRVKARGQRDLITLVGHAAMISAGEFVQASGSWINDRTHGVQFKASFLKATAPTTVEGIEKYLGSGMIRGIGPVYAKKLVRAFGETVFDVIQQEPHRLRGVTGIGPKRAERIIAGWAEQKVIREIMLFLHSNGVGTSRAVRIYKTYGADAVRLISENPYRLARDIRGIGFRTADQIAAKLGIEKTALIRVRAGISFALAEAMDDGHCGLPADELILLAQKLLEVPPDLVETALVLELQDGTVVADDLDGRRCIFLGALYRAEREIAEKLKAMARKPPPWPSIEADKALPSGG